MGTLNDTASPTPPRIAVRSFSPYSTSPLLRVMWVNLMG